MRYRLWPLVLLPSLAILALGCADKSTVGVILSGSVSITTPVPTPMTDSNYTNAYETPADFGIAVYKAGLMTATDTTPSFTIMNLGSPNDATATPLTSAETAIASTPNLPAFGTYNRLLIGISYLEFAVDAVPTQRRFRVYLSSVSPTIANGVPGAVAAGDVLIENPSDTGNYAWINTTNAQPETTRPASPLQIAAGQLPAGSVDPFTTTITLTTPIDLTSGQESLFNISLVAAIQKLFFYDDVDANDSFDYPPGSCIAASDGCLSAVTPAAQFNAAYPGLSATSAVVTPTP